MPISAGPISARAIPALAALHRVEELLALLEQWYEERRGNMALLRVHEFDPVRNEPRFQDLVKKMGLD